MGQDRQNKQEITRLVLSMFSLVIALGSCDDPRAEVRASHEVMVEIAPFEDHFALEETVVLEQSDTAVIARISGMDRRDDGWLLLGDASESNVKMYGPDGHLRRIIGRAGKGPGELSQPRFPRFGPDGLIHIGDAQASKVLVFDGAGTFVRETHLFQFSPIMGFEVLENGDYLLTAGSSEENVLYRVDSGGTVVASFLSKGRLRPGSDSDHPLWRTVSQHWLAVRGDTAFVVTTLSDSLWRVHLPSGTVESMRLVVPGYVTPALPPNMPRDVRDLMAWSKTFHIAAAIIVTPGRVFIPFVQGVLTFGDPMILVTHSASNGWVGFSNAPPMLFADETVAGALLTPNEDKVTLGLFQYR